MPSNNTTFDDDEILQILLKKSFQVPSTYEGTAWYNETVGKSQTILESTDINVEKIPTSPIWNTNALTSSELSSYGVELGIDDTAVSNNFSSTSTTIEAYNGTNYSTSVSFSPGAYIDSTGVVMLFIRLKLDVMVLSDASAIAYVKYPTDTSDNSILDNAFQFNFNLQSNVTSDIAEFKPFYYKLEYSSNGTSFTYLTQDVGNWSFDFKSGILVFSDEPTSINLDSGDLYFTFVKYVGPRGLDKLISVDGTFDSTNTTGYYENQIVVDSSNNEIYLLKDGSWNSIGGGGAFTIDGTNAYYNSGNVGIGTSSPSSILDVSGNANISSDLTVSGDLIIGSSSINVDTKLGELDTSVNLVETSVSNLDTSVNLLETITTVISYDSAQKITTIDGSTNIEGGLTIGSSSINVENNLGELDTSVNILDTSVNILDTSVNILDTSVNLLETSVSILDTSVNILDTSVNLVETSVSNLDTSVNLLETITTDISYDSGVTTISNTLQISDTSVNIFSDFIVNDSSASFIANNSNLYTYWSSGNQNKNIYLYFDTGHNGVVNNKGLILFEGQGYSRQRIHFCLSNTHGAISTNNPTAANMATIDDAVLSLTHDGYVGVGISGPECELDVSGNANITGDLTIDGNLTIGSSSINVENKLGKLDTSVNLLESSVSILDTSVNRVEISVSNLDTSVNLLDTSVNLVETSVSNLDTSVNILDTSVNLVESSVSNLVNLVGTSVSNLDTSVNLLESSVNRVETSVSNLYTSVNLLETSVSILDTSVNLVESSVSNLDTSVNLLETSVSNLDTSVNLLETITTVISYDSAQKITTIDGSTNIEGGLTIGSSSIDVENNLGELDTSVNLLETITTDISYDSGVTTISNKLQVSDTSVNIFSDFIVNDSSASFIANNSNLYTYWSSGNQNKNIYLYFDTGNNGVVNNKGLILFEGQGYSRQRIHFCLSNTHGQMITNHATAENMATIDDAVLSLTHDGYVGVGISGPECELDVSGNANITGGLTIDGNLEIGSSSINVENKLGELDTSVNLLETSVNLLETSVNLLDTSVNLLDTSVNLLETSVDLLETITTNISYGVQLLGGSDSDTFHSQITIPYTAISSQLKITKSSDYNTSDDWGLKVQGTAQIAGGLTIGDDGVMNFINYKRGSATTGNESCAIQTNIDNRGLHIVDSDSTDYSSYAGGANDRKILTLQPYFGHVGIGLLEPDTSYLLDISGPTNITGDLTVGGTVRNISWDNDASTKLKIVGDTYMDGGLVFGTTGATTTTSSHGIKCLNNFIIGRTAGGETDPPTVVNSYAYFNIEDHETVNIGSREYINIYHSSNNNTKGTLALEISSDGLVVEDDLQVKGRIRLFTSPETSYQDGGTYDGVQLQLDSSDLNLINLIVGSSSEDVSGWRWRGRFNSGGGNGGTSNNDFARDGDIISAFFEDSMIVQQALYIFSDSRIKTNVNSIQDDRALIDFRKLNPCYYEYIDNQKRGICEVYGFIAQEVNEVLPNSCSIGTNNVPNVFSYADISGNRLILESGTFENLELDLKDSSGNVYESVVIGLEKKTGSIINFTIKEIIDNSSIDLSYDLLSLDISSELCVYNEDTGKHRVFVYGQLVNNFYRLNKNAIWTVAAAALQEVDRQQQSDKVRIAELESEVYTLKTQMADLKTQMADLLARVSTLENSDNATTTDGS